MNRRFVCSIRLLLLMLAIFPLAACERGTPAFQQGSVAGATIVVDAGHGDTDVGTIGVSGRYEKDVNLEIAKKLEAALVEKGATVVMTRSSDAPLGPAEEQDISQRKELDMQKREEIIAGAGAAFVISIHQNSFEDASIAGPQMFYLVNSDTGEERGVQLAETLQSTVNTELSIQNPRQAGPGNWRLLKAGAQPGVIVECGFFSNPEEEALLQTESYQNKLVDALVKGLEQYIKKYGTAN